MDYQTPKQARLEHIKGYQRLVQYYKEQISHFDEVLEQKEMPELKKKCYLALQDVCKIELKKCQKELRTLL